MQSRLINKLLLLAALLMSACSGESEVPMTPVKVEIVATESGYQLLRGGEPYVVKGAGMAVDDIENFASHGGNSIRNWSTGADYQDTKALLDSAYRNGVTVALCLSVRAARHGFDCWPQPDFGSEVCFIGICDALPAVRPPLERCTVRVPCVGAVAR